MNINFQVAQKKKNDVGITFSFVEVEFSLKNRELKTGI